MMYTFARAVSAGFAVSLLAGCGVDNGASDLEGRWVGPGEAAVDMKSNGTAEGNDGCNVMAANWKATSESTGLFSVSESTEIGCPGVVGWGDATTYVLAGGTLIIESSDGTDLTELTRAD